MAMGWAPSLRATVDRQELAITEVAEGKLKLPFRKANIEQTDRTLCDRQTQNRDIPGCTRVWF